MLIDQLTVFIFTLAFIVWIACFSSFGSLKFGIIMFCLALPMSYTIFNLNNPVKNYEAKLKKKFMNRFLDVFGSFEWHRGDAVNVTQNVHIFPKSFFSMFDDYIYGFYKNNIELTISECKIERNSFLTILPALIPTFIITLLLSIFSICIIAVIFVHGTVHFTWYNPISYVFSALLLLPFITCFKLAWSSINRGNFQGLIIETSLPKKFSGITYFYEKNPYTNKNVENNIRQSIQPVLLEDVEFNANYNVLSDNQIEARYILTTAFIARFKNLKDVYNANYVRAEFKDNKMFVIINTGRDLFNFSPYKKLSKKDFDKVYKGLSMVFSLIDVLKLDVKTGL